jgi:phosphoribosylglycinamide formyltransferase-1
MNIALSVFCKNLGLDLILTTKPELFDELDKLGDIEYVLLATGNIIEERIVNRYRVINSHPGYLPDIKGLDALKWAVYFKEKIGVTTHFVNNKVDDGIIIERNIVPLYKSDTFHNLAYRQYEMEVDMLISSVKTEPMNVKVAENKYGTFRRMPNRLEPEMLEKFEELKKETGI